MRKSGWMLAGALLLTSSTLLAGDRWFNLHVTDPQEPVEVTLRVPLPLVTAALDGVRMHRAWARHVEIGDCGIDLDWRRLVERARAVPDGGEVRFADVGDDVVVSRRAGMVRLQIMERRDEAVEIELPGTLLDNLRVHGNRLDLEPFMRRLGQATGEVLRVKSGRTRVRMWVEEL